jgi:hypothetical protein
MLKKIQMQFGAWTKCKGDRNLLVMEEVPRFTEWSRIVANSSRKSCLAEEAQQYRVVGYLIECANDGGSRTTIQDALLVHDEDKQISQLWCSCKKDTSCALV